MYKDDLRKIKIHIKDILNKEGILNISKLDMASIIFASILYKGDDRFIKEIEDSENPENVNPLSMVNQRTVIQFNKWLTENGIGVKVFDEADLETASMLTVPDSRYTPNRHLSMCRNTTRFFVLYYLLPFLTFLSCYF